MLNAIGNVQFTSGSNSDPALQSNVQRIIRQDRFGSSAVAGEEILPPFNAFSPSAIVEGNLVYVNFARISDFQKLKDLGVIVQDRILIARNGKIHQVRNCYVTRQTIHIRFIYIYQKNVGRKCVL
jgi:hypothetical protein